MQGFKIMGNDVLENGKGDYGLLPGGGHAYHTLCAARASALVIICAEPGMGKTCLLTQSVLARMRRGDKARYVDMVGDTPVEAAQRMREIARWSSKQHDLAAAASEHVYVALDNLPVGDEITMEKLATIIRRMSSEGTIVVIACRPESAAIAEYLREATTFWSCDLLMGNTIGEDCARTYNELSAGIPVLLKALEKVNASSREYDNACASPSYLEPYVSLVSETIRPSMMEEERRLRATMLLLGVGTSDEVRNILGGLDDGLWREMARDVPLFGINLIDGTFSCVGSLSMDCLNASYAPISRIVKPWPKLVGNVAKHLAERGDISRAAIVTLMCSDELERCTIVLEWGIEMVDAGEVNVVDDALTVAEDEGWIGISGFYETECFLWSLGYRKTKTQMSLRHLHEATRKGRRAAWALRARELLRGGSLRLDVDCQEEGELLDDALATRLKALTLLFHGNVGDAYDLLLNAPCRLEDSSVSCAMLQTDYVLCSLLVGIVPSVLDMEAFERGRLLFERAGLTWLVGMQDAVITAGRLLSGRLMDTRGLESPMQRAGRDKDVLLRGLLLVALSVGDMRAGALTRCHVRLEQAMTAFGICGSEELTKVGRLLDLSVRSWLGDKISKVELSSCKGVSQAHNRVVSVLECALMPSSKARSSGAGRKRSLPYSKDVHWLVNVLSADCGPVSRRFRNVMPPSWKDAVTRVASDVDGFAEDACGMSCDRENVGEREKRRPSSTRARPHTDARVEVSMLGGFEVFVDGTRVSDNRLERRRAKALLALLAAIPGHVAKRYVIMESIWPTYDYERANKCVYAATSVLRSEMGMRLAEGAQELALIVSNKAQGTVALNTAVIGCDMDLFEEKAHKALDLEGQDRAVIDLCREIEDLYRGDLFVPPTDGMGVVATRSRELRDLFADVMIAGSVAATNLAMKTIACRFARKAHDANNTREDALRALVVALCAAGRQVEAERCYEQFVGRVVDVSRRPPSRQLREVVEALLKHGGSGLGMRAGNERSSSMAHIRIVPREQDQRGAQLSLDLDDEQEPMAEVG